MFWRVLQR